MHKKELMVLSKIVFIVGNAAEDRNYEISLA
jgi:hypothetical protein